MTKKIQKKKKNMKKRKKRYQELKHELESIIISFKSEISFALQYENQMTLLVCSKFSIPKKFELELIITLSPSSSI